MGTSQNKTTILISLFSLLVLVGFQNCSDVDFRSSAADSVGKVGGEFGESDDDDLNDPDEVEYLKRSCASVGFLSPSGNALVDAQDIVSLNGGVRRLEFRSINNIGTINGGTNYIYASESIGNIDVVNGGTNSIVAKSIGSLGRRNGGLLCVRVNEIGDLTRFNGGTGVFESVGARGSIATMPGTNGGTKIFKNYEIGTVESGNGGTLRLENSRIELLVLGNGGTVVLVNSYAERIVQSGSAQLVLQNSTYGALQ